MTVRFNSKQSGFSVIEALLLLVIVGMLGFVGWFVWSTNVATNKSLRDTDAVNNSIAPKASSITNFEECKKAGGRIQESYPEVCVYGNKSFTNNSVTVGYLKIKEWNVKFPLNKKTKDIEYSIASDNPNLAMIGAESITMLSVECQSSEIGIGGIIRTKSEKEATDYLYDVKFGQFYYAYVTSKATCIDMDNQPDEEIISKINGLKSSKETEIGKALQSISSL